jgi:hypothetical protein
MLAMLRVDSVAQKELSDSTSKMTEVITSLQQGLVFVHMA